MAILRSRAASDQVHAATYPAVVQAQAQQARLVEEASAKARAEAEHAAQAKIQAAEARAAQAEQRASQAEASVRADYERRLGQAIAALAGASARLETLEKQLVEEAEADVVRLALLIAARLVRREIEDDPTWMEPVLTEALALVSDKRGVAVRMHPEDAAVATERRQLILAEVPGIERLEIFPDATLARGACVLASQGTRLDASLSGSWERLFRMLVDQAPKPALEIPVPPAETP